MNFHKISVFMYYLFCGPILLATSANADQFAPSRHWVFSPGANTVEASARGIRITQKTPVDTSEYASASAKLLIANASAWRVSFDVRFGVLRPSGAIVRLYKGADNIGWVGADVWTKNMGVCIGDNDFKLTTPADSEWHHFEYVSDGRTISVWHNGQKVGEGNSVGAPDRIFVGSLPPAKGSGSQQTEVWLRDVQEDAQKVVYLPRALSQETKTIPVANDNDKKDDKDEFSEPPRHHLEAMMYDIGFSVEKGVTNNGHIIDVTSYSDVSTFEWPYLKYREKTIIGKTYYQVDMSKVDPASIRSLYIPGDQTDSSYLAPEYLVDFSSLGNKNVFVNTDEIEQQTTNVSDETIDFSDKTSADNFMDNFRYVVRYIAKKGVAK